MLTVSHPVFIFSFCWSNEIIGVESLSLGTEPRPDHWWFQSTSVYDCFLICVMLCEYFGNAILDIVSRRKIQLV